MNTRRPKSPAQGASSPPTGHASLDELRRRAGPLRTAIAHARDLKQPVDAFYDGFVKEELLYESSRQSDEPRLHAVLDSVCARFPGERIEKQLFFSEPLGLFHGALSSSRRVGWVFQFVGDPQGVIALSPLARGANTDFFRYTLLLEAQVRAPANTVRSRGGSA